MCDGSCRFFLHYPYQIEEILSIPSLLRGFIINGDWIFQKFFCLLTWLYDFSLSSVNRMICMDWLIVSASYSWGKPNHICSCKVSPSYIAVFDLLIFWEGLLCLYSRGILILFLLFVFVCFVFIVMHLVYYLGVCWPHKMSWEVFLPPVFVEVVGVRLVLFINFFFYWTYSPWNYLSYKLTLWEGV